MGIILGIDIGGSTTKIVGLIDDEIFGAIKIKATDPVSSLFGAFGKFTYENNINLKDIQKIMITGVGSSYITESIYGLPTKRVEEFYCNGLGGLYLAKLDKAVIVSMGTGTALVSADGINNIKHIGGTAIGGGTLVGLSKKIIDVHNMETILSMASHGKLEKIDLTVGNITDDILPGLPPDTTASNFGNLSDTATKSDLAAGILNLVLQSICTSSIFAIHNTDFDKIVMIGNLSSLPQCKQIVSKMKMLSKVDFIIPENSVFGTAVGAALSCNV